MTLTIIGRLFSLGEVVITHSASDALSNSDVNSGLIRHMDGDWGDVPAADRRLNQQALKSGERLMSEYRSSKGVRYWIITEWDRSVTTILLPTYY